MATAKEYTLCFLTHGDQLLLLNRRKAPWMGSWNGVGGKRNANETPQQCAFREVEEETGFTHDAYTVRATGLMRWVEDGQLSGMLHLYWMELHDSPAFASYPILTDEGILMFHSLAWTMDKANTGAVTNLRFLVPALLAATAPVKFECDYDREGNLISALQVA